MNKINDSAIMNKSAKKTATTHTRDRCQQLRIDKEYINLQLSALIS